MWFPSSQIPSPVFAVILSILGAYLTSSALNEISSPHFLHSLNSFAVCSYLQFAPLRHSISCFPYTVAPSFSIISLATQPCKPVHIEKPMLN